MPKYNISTNNARARQWGGASGRPTMPAVLSLDKGETRSYLETEIVSRGRAGRVLPRGRIRREGEIVEFN